MVGLSQIVEIVKTGGVKSLYQRLRCRLTSPNYNRWITSISEEKSEAVLRNRPLISILLPIYNANSAWLIKAIESVLNQQYGHWQLCIVIVEAVSVSTHIRSLLIDFLADERIDMIGSDENSSFSAALNLNRALKIAKGDFFTLLECSDELATNALYEVVKYLNIEPDTDFIYTDNDQITSWGNRKNPFFKPDWSPDYCQACLSVCHLGVYRTRLVRRLGGFRSDYDGAQNWDLILRLTEKTRRIHHIPKVLYHKRLSSSLSIFGTQAIPWANDAAQRALQDAVDRSNYPGTVKPYPKKPGFFIIRRHIQGNPRVSIIIPSAGACLKIKGQQVCLLVQCIDSIRRRSTYKNFEIILVDGYDIPQIYLDMVQGAELKLVRCNQPFNFSRRINLGATAAGGDVLLMLNDDIEVITPDWIEAMLELAQQEDIAAVGAKLFYPNGRLQHAGMVILAGNPSHAFHNGSGKHDGYYGSNVVNRNYLGVTGACLMMRRRVFEELDGFDESFPLSYNDVDLCLRAHQAGYRNVFTPYAKLFHYESVSRVSKLRPGELERLHRRFADTHYMVNDPYYNPNLSLRRPFFQLAWPDERRRS